MFLLKLNSRNKTSYRTFSGISTQINLNENNWVSGDSIKHYIMHKIIEIDTFINL